MRPPRSSTLLVIIACSLLSVSISTVRATAPVATNIEMSVVTGGSTGGGLQIFLPGYVTWDSGDPYSLNYSVVSQPLHGTAGVSNRQIWYSSTPGFTGTDSCTWMGSGTASTNVATCTITVVPNSVPVATSSAATAESGSPTSIANLPGLVSHAYLDFDSGQVLSLQLNQEPAHGTAFLDRSGNLIYRSDPGYSGIDRVYWKTSDGWSASGTAQITVTVTVTPSSPLNQTAVAVKNTPVTIVPATTETGTNDQPVLSPSGPSHGTVVSDGTVFTYTPALNYVGNDSFQWHLQINGTFTPSVTCSVVVKDSVGTLDWPQWRHDECRTGTTAMPLASKLYLRWRRDVPVEPGAFEVMYDLATGEIPDVDYCHPVQLGKRLFVPSLYSDAMTAYDTETGAELWRYYASGALRRPPAAVTSGTTDLIIFGSDDGNVYCLNAADGTERWKFAAAPTPKKAMAFKRLSSLWPVWSSPVIHDGKVYFVAGYLPTWVLFGYCLDISSGQVFWKNDGQMLECGWNSSFGPLTLSNDHSKLFGTVPGKSMAWVLDAATGDLMGHTGYPSSKSNGCITLAWIVDSSGTNSCYENLTLVSGGRTITTKTAFNLGVREKIGSMIAGDGKLIVSTTTGRLYCFGNAAGAPQLYTTGTTPLPNTNDSWTTAVQSMLSREDLKHGLALVWGVGQGRVAEELVKQAPGLVVVAADQDPAKLQALRRKMDEAGIPAKRFATLHGDPSLSGFAPYQAALIASEDLTAAGYTESGTFSKEVYRCLRPYGGEAWLPTTTAQHTSLTDWLASANLPTCSGTASYQASFSAAPGIASGGFTRISRTGLPDTAIAFRAPLRPIVLGANKNNISLIPSTFPSADIVKGDPSHGVKNGYDVYSWIETPAAGPGYEPPLPSNNNVQLPSSPSTLYSGSSWNPLLSRIESSPAVFQWAPLPEGAWMQNCSGHIRYGNLVMKPGKIGYVYDGSASNYWGALVMPEVGSCGNWDFAGDGLIGIQTSTFCLCNHDISFTQFGLVSTDDPTDEVWVHHLMAVSSNAVNDERIRHLAINFGAPGDRVDLVNQMPWYHFPTTGRLGEPAPLVPVTYQGSLASRYHHGSSMLQTTGTRGWVSASSVSGMTRLSIPVSNALVATQAGAAPSLDGALNDACWASGPRTTFYPIPPKTPGPVPFDRNCYTMLRYDANKLYIAGGIHATEGKYMRVALNSRERLGPPLVFMIGNSAAPASLQISTSAWQGAYKTGTTRDCFTGEIAIPWTALDAAGLWKEQLVINVQLGGAVVNGDEDVSITGISDGGFSSFLSPLYFESTRGVISENQAHTVRLFFSEMDVSGTGQRVFDVALQGTPVLTGFDPAAQGGYKRELIREFQNVRFTDRLNIEFTPRTGTPMISGVEIVNTDSDTPNVPPTPAIDASATSGPAPLAVTFSARRSTDADGQIVECVWETGDGRLARGSRIDHVFAEPGLYQVNLLVRDNRGESATTGTTISVTAGSPSAFVSSIRASGGDYTSLSAWNSAMASDLTSTAVIYPVSAKGTYVAADNGMGLTFTGSGTGVLAWLDTVKMIAAVTATSGTINPGTVTLTNGHTFAISTTGTAYRQLLFQITNRGSYTATDDGAAITFAGGGTGVLKHINAANLGYVANCRGTIFSGTVHCSSGHSFTVSGTGSPIFTAVAEGYNDWTTGLADTVMLTGTQGWVTDPRHCVIIRPAAGQAHSGIAKTNGTYAGFGLASAKALDATGLPNTRLERLIVGGTATSGLAGSFNRVLGNITVGGSGSIIANSVGATFRCVPSTVTTGYPAMFLNCTGSAFYLASDAKFGVRTLNCLAYASGTIGFQPALTSSNDPTRQMWLNHCISAGSSATSCDLWKDGMTGNSGGVPISFLNASTGDYRLANSDAAAIGRGQAGLGNDAAGNPRLGPTYDAGAFQTSGTGKPFLLSGTVLGAGRISLQWSCSPSSGETGYRVEVSTDGGTSFSTLAGGLSLNPSAFSTDNVPPISGTQTYRVTAFNTGGDTIQSNALSLTPLNAMQAWLLSHSLPADATGDGNLSACPANDGISNLIKYGLGIDPNQSGFQSRYSAGNLRISGSSYLSLTYTRPEPPPPDVSYLPEAACSLTGTWSGTGMVEVISSTSSGLRTSTVRDSQEIGAGHQRFIRLRITTP